MRMALNEVDQIFKEQRRRQRSHSARNRGHKTGSFASFFKINIAHSKDLH